MAMACMYGVIISQKDQLWAKASRGVAGCSAIPTSADCGQTTDRVGAGYECACGS